MVREGKVGNFLNVVGADETYQLQKVAVEQSRLGIPLLFGLDVIHGTAMCLMPRFIPLVANFEYEHISMSKAQVTMTEQFTITDRVKNTG